MLLHMCASGSECHSVRYSTFLSRIEIPKAILLYWNVKISFFEHFWTLVINKVIKPARCKETQTGIVVIIQSG